ncbi:hypothetical protein ISN44_As13g016240 [Arabidopsis suecica]|uniref:Retrotransposon gag domain-containing protein n=1 Tax=Arabidopsis suecica TaxID=45249 RepID=A0A8T1Y0P5_ARASU|nr:hypothetical protein ISN44_As13g016240 [Arabidopsis suecica]
MAPPAPTEEQTLTRTRTDPAVDNGCASSRPQARGLHECPPATRKGGWVKLPPLYCSTPPAVINIIVGSLGRPDSRQGLSKNKKPIIIIEHSELPEFHGGQSAEELLDWMVTVEETLELRCIPLERSVPMVAMRFRGTASAWWSQLKTFSKAYTYCDKDLVQYSVEEYYTEFFSLSTRADMHESDQQTVARFVGGLREGLQHHLKFLNPLTLAEAHQQALIVEAKKKGRIFRANVRDGVQIFTFGWCLATFTTIGVFTVLDLRR